MLHMDYSNGLMSDVSWITSDKRTEMDQQRELEEYAKSLPGPRPSMAGARYWALEVRGDNRKAALRDDNVKKHDRGQAMYDALKELGAATIKHHPKR